MLFSHFQVKLVKELTDSVASRFCEASDLITHHVCLEMLNTRHRSEMKIWDRDVEIDAGARDSYGGAYLYSHVRDSSDSLPPFTFVYRRDSVSEAAIGC